MNYLKFFALLFICLTGQAQQCDYTLSGKVIDFHDGSNLIGAVLSVESQQVYAETDLDGNYSLQGLCAGKTVITVTHPECDVKTFTIEISKDLTRDFKLEHHTEELNQVTVKVKSTAPKPLPAPKNP